MLQFNQTIKKTWRQTICIQKSGKIEDIYSFQFQFSIINKTRISIMRSICVYIVILSLLYSSVSSTNVRSERQHQMAQYIRSSIKHEQGALSEVAVAAAKQLLQRPYETAQIPTKLINGAVDGLKSTFEGAWNLKDRSRSLQLTFSNLLNNNLILEQNYFNSGTWFQSWQPILKPMSINQGTVANSQGGFATGVTGGMRFRIDGTNIYVYVGFCNPYIGGYKFYGEISSIKKPASYGYERSFDNYPKNTYWAGYRLQVVQTPSTITQMAFVYQLSKM